MPAAVLAEVELSVVEIDGKPKRIKFNYLINTTNRDSGTAWTTPEEKVASASF